MKKLFAFFMLISMSVIAFGQAPKVEDRVAALENQVKTLQSEATAMRSEISTLKDRYAQYQKQLNLTQITKVTVDSISYGVLSAVGNKATGEITITLSAVNKSSADRDIQFYNVELNDFDGNLYYVSDFNSQVNMGGRNNGSRANARVGIPIKIFITFKDVAVGSRIANLHAEEIAGFGNSKKINFRDIPVDWK